VVEIGWVGDTTPGSKYGSPPRHGRALFEHVRDRLQAPDLMVGNLEGTFGNGGKSKSDGGSSNTYSFQAPPENAEALAWAGFDVMSLANNHAYDYFEKGLSATRKALASNSIADTGLPGQITVREANGVKVAFVAFSPYRWNASLANISEAGDLVRKAKKQADVVVVLMHAGAEGADKTHTPEGAEKAYGEFRGDPRAFSHAMIDAGASAVLGSGPHVVRGVERYNGQLIAYSLGNFAGWDNFKQGGDLSLSGLLTVRIAKNGDILGGRWLSLKIAEPGVPVPDSKQASLKLVNELSESDFKETFVMDSKGRFGPGR
jgi:poly-gamma-glutamate capsule biosynthesis protein CapA/YwtB (metallophosphatase superfamily)